MIDEIAYGGWNNNLRLRGATTELIVTLDVGPRIIRYGRQDGPNVFVELPEQMGGANESDWQLRGGHRFWTAPEAEHSYEPDNGPVTWSRFGDHGAEIAQGASRKFGFRKTLRVELLPGDDEIARVTHCLTNIGEKPLLLTPWALSVMAAGGTALIPQPALDLHPSEFPEGREAKPEEFLPNRELVLWPFTDLMDGRYRFSERFLRLTQRAGMPATKIGFKIPTGWIAYENGGLAFAKHFARDNGQPYPDRGVNLELYSDGAILELESLAPLNPIPPGETRHHVEHWLLRETGKGLADEAAATAFFTALPELVL